MSWMKLLVAVFLLAVALFCVYGFMATFEPMDRAKQLGWRIGYAAVGLACLAGVLWQIVGIFRGRTAAK